MKLVLESLEETRTKIDAMTPEDKAELSADWLSRLAAAKHADPWILGFTLHSREDDSVVGQCGYKGPPSEDGMVEIAYYVEESLRGQGYATEAAEALTAYAFAHDDVRLVRAHTLPQSNASTRVLTKAGFQKVGEVIDPEDGPVWRWEKTRQHTP